MSAGATYVLVVVFPDDVPRTMFIANRGAETIRGVRTGTALGDVVHTYTNNNLSSLKIPHTRTHLRWRQVFTLNERFAGIQQPRGSGRRPDTPEDGFLVIIAQPSRRNAPNSQGAAVSRIALYEVLEPSTLSLDVTPPVGFLKRLIHVLLKLFLEFYLMLLF